MCIRDRLKEVKFTTGNAYQNQTLLKRKWRFSILTEVLVPSPAPTLAIASNICIKVSQRVGDINGVAFHDDNKVWLASLNGIYSANFPNGVVEELEKTDRMCTILRLNDSFLLCGSATGMYAIFKTNQHSAST
eukprot:TRINITY_DN8155_c0_g2_i2.p2 TRINITY_DN8155_c0_g2~~TRINITY_DN8155_c0_g2_i2.p2  ORF type:complete len:133 (+),score=9.87 TRINITY_DN8155_c0_g2_i2:105-503(+)